MHCSRDCSGSLVQWGWMLSRAAEAAEESPRTPDAKHHPHKQAKAKSPASDRSFYGGGLAALKLITFELIYFVLLQIYFLN
ncbi:MAG: hypothetical protein L3J66_11910 [Bacteroidales bacterium]|nr:hypothetical protein [Bacteroidales bacterium]